MNCPLPGLSLGCLWVKHGQSLGSMLSAVPFGMMIPNDAQLIKLFPGPNQQVDMFLVVSSYFPIFESELY